VPNGAFALGYSDRAELLGVGTGWGDVVLIDFASGRTRVFPEGHHRSIESIDFQDVRRILTSSTDHRVKVWDVATGRLQKVLHETETSGGSGRIYSAAVIPCHNAIVTASLDGVLRSWDFESGRIIRKLVLNLVGHKVAERRMVLSLGASRLAVASADGYLLIYDVKNALQSEKAGSAR